MEIVKWQKQGGGQMVRVTEREALLIIQSLVAQMLTKNCNTERAEFTDQTGSYFSIAVHSKGSETNDTGAVCVKGHIPLTRYDKKLLIEKVRKQGIESLTEDEINRLQNLGVEFIELEDGSSVYLRKKT